jgi:2-haloacid dehalogenase
MMMSDGSKLNFSDFEVLTFDCYGTLIDWETGILNAVRKALAAHGKSAEDNEILETYARLEAAAEAGPYQPYRAILRTVMHGIGEHFGSEFTVEQLDSLPESIQEWQPFPDTVESLQRLKSKYKLAILSNIDNDLFAASARRLQVEFDHIVTAQQLASYKPATFNFEMALAKIGRPAHKILHVAESIYHDVVPAQKLGLKTVWLHRRMGKPGFGATKPADAKPDLELPDLKSLADLAL